MDDVVWSSSYLQTPYLLTHLFTYLIVHFCTHCWCDAPMSHFNQPRRDAPPRVRDTGLPQQNEVYIGDTRPSLGPDGGSGTEVTRPPGWRLLNFF